MAKPNSNTPGRKTGRRNEPDAPPPSPANDLQEQVERTPGGMFAKGKSGNPKGRTRGSRNKATEAAALLLAGEAEALTRKAVELALEGDTTALRLCLERIYPAPKDRPVAVDLPPVETAADLPRATAALLAAVARGAITPQEGNALAAIVAAHGKAVDVAEIDARITALEAAKEQRR